MSNRLTFSLASLIFLIAFGLVFAPVSVMAHEPGHTDSVFALHHDGLGSDQDTSGISTDAQLIGNALQTEKGHTHRARPTVSSIELVDVKIGANKAARDKSDAESTVAGTHVILVDNAAPANTDAVTAITDFTSSATTDGEFRIKITFSEDVYTPAAEASDYGPALTGNTLITDLIASAAITDAAASKAAPGVQITALTISEVARSTDADDDNKVFFATVTVPAGELPSLDMDVWIGVIANAVYSKGKFSGGNTTDGRGNDESSQTMFTIVQTFDEDPPEVASFTPDSSKFNSAGDAEFTIEFNEALASSGDGALAVGDFDIENGTAVSLSGPTSPTEHEYTLTVTPTDVNEGVRVTLKVDSVADAVGNKGPAKDPAADRTAMVVEDIKPAVTVTVAQVVKPSAADPTTDTKAKFRITFTEALSTSHFNALNLINDIAIVGGTAVATDLTGPTVPSPAVATDLQPDQIYELTVTPDASLEDGDTVSVTVNPQIQDLAGNNIDLTRGTPSASFNIDLLAPTVVITAPTEPLTDGKLEFVFLFSEPIEPATFTASDIVGEDYVVKDAPMKDATYTPPAGTMKERWTAKVEPTGNDDVTVVLNVNAVADKVGRLLSAGTFAIYKGPNTDPFFPANAAVKNLPAGLCVEDALPADVTLPLANDTEGDTLTYSLTGGTSATRTIPNASRAAGFYWETIDTQTRVLKGTATLADSGTYTWTVTDSHGAMDTMTFTITVKDHQVPAMPIGLAADKVESDSMVSPTKNIVRLTWTAPGDKTAYPDCIPAVTSYTVTRTTLDRLAGTFGNAVTHAVSTAATTFDVPELPVGIYKFTITATNSAGTSDASVAAVWGVTGGTHVVVADPPASPTDLDANINSNSITLDWLKVPDTQDGGAPIYDDLVAMTHTDYAKLIKVRSDFYGSDVAMDAMKDYAGYVVYQTNEKTAVVTRYPATGTLMAAGDANSDDKDDPFDYAHPAFQISGLTAGEYTFRVVAKNIAGESDDSQTATKRVLIVPAAPNNAPTFATGAKIDNIVATVNVAIPGSVLPEATDADTGDTLTYSIEPDLPDGLEFDDDSRALTGTPTEAMEQTTYTYKVEDDNDGEDTIGFLITVNAALDPTNAAPTFADDAKINNIVATVNVAIDGRILPEATDADSDDTLTYSLTPDLPDGLEFDDDSRALTGTPTEAMEQTLYTYKVEDDNDGEDSISFFITVNALPPAKNTAPAFAADAKIDNIVATVGQAIDGRFLPEATDADSDDTLTYSLTPDLPAGLDFDADTRALTGTPTEIQAQTLYTYKVEDDNDGEDSISFFITVNALPPAKNTAPAFAADAKIDNIVATVGQAIDGRFLPEATDADSDDTLTYSLTPDLPAGLDFDADTRALTGTPIAEQVQTPYTYKVMDRAAGASDVKSDSISFFITVKAATAGPGQGTPTATLPAKGYLVYVRSLANAPVFGTSNPAVAEWSGMPDLYALFTEGGGGSLQLNVTGVDARKVVMTEVMWAVDEGKVGQNSYTGQQWIEVYNTTDTAIPATSISFATGDGRPALAQGTDLISNVVGGGSAWIRTKGQNGNSGAADGSGKKEFISMYRKERGKDGWNGGHWAASTNVYHPNHKGTPGKGEATGPKIITASGVALGTIFNEIANHPSGNHKHEWIELRKREGELSNLENWVVDMVTGVNAQKRLFKIPKLNDGRYGDLLLITKTDPARDDNHPLRGGYNVEKDDADQSNEGRDKNIRYYVADDWTTDLPDNGEFVLILRHGADKTNHEKVEDLAGYHPNLKVDDANTFTNLWPLLGYAAPNIALNKIDSGKVHRRQKDNIPGTKTADKADNADHVALRDEGWKGVGYKRNASAGAQNGGTPGYPNNAVLSNETQAGADPVIISEVMYATGDRGNIPQWIELRNTSQAAGVNLDGWRITIVNHDQDIDGDYAGDLNKSYNINGKIPPGQTFLIVAHSGTDNTNLPSERIVAIAKRRGDLILSQYGFEITVETKEKDGKRGLADQVGNLADLPTGRVRANYQSYEEPAWMLPAGTNDNGDRVSIVRTSIKGTLQDGKLSDAWKLFDMSVHINAPESTYYGNRNDLASPGYTNSGVLPVSLSKFRPERMKDTGQVVIRWVTESELNNAGFNILRGEAIDGEFTKLNKQLIAGQGTTSEKTSYTFVDKSAKPNVVYYYQIQDVSLEGQVQTLRTTHLRGNVSAVGKLTTTWGELKALQ